MHCQMSTGLPFVLSPLLLSKHRFRNPVNAPTGFITHPSPPFARALLSNSGCTANVPVDSVTVPISTFPVTGSRQAHLSPISPPNGSLPSHHPDTGNGSV